MKLDSNLEVEWTEEYGECDGSDQLFDFVVDRLVVKKYKKKQRGDQHRRVNKTRKVNPLRRPL